MPPMHPSEIDSWCCPSGIAKWDVPNEWPELLGQLVGVINERKNAAAVDGAVRCLATFVEDLDDIQLVQVWIPSSEAHSFSFASTLLYCACC